MSYAVVQHVCLQKAIRDRSDYGENVDVARRETHEIQPVRVRVRCLGLPTRDSRICNKGKAQLTQTTLFSSHGTFSLPDAYNTFTMIVVHHLGISQSERIVWLLEELELPYKLVKHVRDPVMAPESLKSLPGNTTGKSPFIEDTEAGITLSESGAISDYIIGRYGDGGLALKPDDAHFHDYLYWLHYSNATQQMTMQVVMFLGFAGLAEDNVATQVGNQRLHAMLQQTDDRLQDNKWLAGPVFTAADIMSVYGLTTQRYFGPQVGLEPYPNIVRWLKDCSERAGYKRAMEAGDPEMHLLMEAKAPSKSLLNGGVHDDFWRKKT